MTTHTDAQNEKRRTSTPNAETPDAETPVAALLGALNGPPPPMAALEVWRQMMNYTEECARFGAQRAERYRDFYHDLGSCASPADAMSLYADASQAALQDYMEEAVRLGDAMRNVWIAAQRQA